MVAQRHNCRCGSLRTFRQVVECVCDALPWPERPGNEYLTIGEPEGITTTYTRDAYGKPLTCGKRLFLDTLDLYQARGRHAFAKDACVELGVPEESVLSNG